MSIFRWFLLPLAPFFQLVVRARNLAFERNNKLAVRASLPVVSIGNISVGGTGKTPLTMHLAQTLDKLGYKNVILSRGYGGRRAVDPMGVSPESSPSEVGDEPAMMAKHLGPNRVVVGRRRYNAALRATSEVQGIKVLILDDGFQHRSLHRDIDILLLDGIRLWGNGKMLPMGYLREPMSSAKRAHALAVTRGRHAKKNKIEAWWQKFGSGGPIFYVDFQIGALRNVSTGLRLALPANFGPLFAFCALGHPEAFYADLLVAGLRWVDTKSFRDHKAISPAQIRKLASLAMDSGAEGLVCTEKDAVKFSESHITASNIPIWVAEQEILGTADLVSWITNSLGNLAQ